MKSFVNQVLTDEISGFNVLAREETQDDRRVVMLGHTEQNYLSLLFKELGKYGLLTKYSIAKRETIYSWDENWIPSENTRITYVRESAIAVESGFLLKFFPSIDLAKPLINFLINRCHNNGKDCIRNSWEVPYIATNNIKHPELISTKEIITKGNEGIQSYFVSDGFKTNLKTSRKMLFKPFAEFVRT